jgi:hypothetical protein
MTIGTYGSASQYGDEYRRRKAQMWLAFSQMKVPERISILFEESWGMLLFVLGLVVYHVLAPLPYRLVMRVFDLSAMAQTASVAQIPPSWALALVGFFYLVLLFILLGCVGFLLTGG